MRLARFIVCASLLLAAGCQGGDADAPAGSGEDPSAVAVAPAEKGVPLPDPSSTEAYDGIGADEVLHFTGTEPFWGGKVDGGSLTYSTPENQDGTTIAVKRFAGRGGISFSGTLDQADFEMVVTPLECSDGMSERTYPFTVTLELGEETRNGCGWTDKQRFEGPEQP